MEGKTAHCLCCLEKLERPPLKLEDDGLLTRVKGSMFPSDEHDYTVLPVGDIPLVFSSDEGDSSVHDHLKNFFVLKKILKIKDEVLHELLGLCEGQSRPENWINVCSACGKLVKKFYEDLQLISKLERRLLRTESALREKIIKSKGKEGAGDLILKRIRCEAMKVYEDEDSIDNLKKEDIGNNPESDGGTPKSGEEHFQRLAGGKKEREDEESSKEEPPEPILDLVSDDDDDASTNSTENHNDPDSFEEEGDDIPQEREAAGEDVIEIESLHYEEINNFRKFCNESNFGGDFELALEERVWMAEAAIADQNGMEINQLPHMPFELQQNERVSSSSSSSSSPAIFPSNNPPPFSSDTANLYLFSIVTETPQLNGVHPPPLNSIRQEQEVAENLGSDQGIGVSDNHDYSDSSSTTSVLTIPINPSSDDEETEVNTHTTPDYDTKVFHRFCCRKCPYFSPHLSCITDHLLCHKPGQEFIVCKVCKWHVAPRRFKEHLVRRHPYLYESQRKLMKRKAQSSSKSGGINGRTQQRHAANHNPENRINCPECNAVFITLSDFEEHKKLHSGDGRLTCDVCGWTTKNLAKHMLKWHASLPTPSPPGYKRKLPPPPPEEDDEEDGGDAIVSIAQRDKMRNLDNSNPLYITITVDGTKIYKCRQCGARMRRLFLLKTHLKVHDDTHH